MGVRQVNWTYMFEGFKYGSYTSIWDYCLGAMCERVSKSLSWTSLFEKYGLAGLSNNWGWFEGFYL